MIRAIGKKEDPYEYIAMTEERLRGMETLASTHITWYTHKNPYGCWICDMFQLGQALIDSFREFLGPMDVDAGKESSTSSECSIEDLKVDEEEEVEEEEEA